MEKGETTAQAALRETVEEARAHVRVGALYTVFNLPHIDQVYLIYRARVLDLDYAPGHESLKVELFREEDIPWDGLAFRVITETLKLYFKDRGDGAYRTHVGDIVRQPGNGSSYKVSVLTHRG